jgi:hypothetical protein
VPACNTRFFWRVRGINDVGNGVWSSVFSFTTGGKMPTSSSGSSPKGNALAGSNDNVTFIWSAAAEATSYHLRIKKSASPFTIVFEDSAATGTSRNVKASVLGTGGFTWEVRPKNACGMSGWSTPLQFSLTVTSVNELDNEVFDAIISAQLVADLLNIVVQSASDDVVAVRIISLGGNEVLSMSQPVSSGRSNLMIPSADNLAPGLYTVVVSSERGSWVSLPLIKL